MDVRRRIAVAHRWWLAAFFGVPLLYVAAAIVAMLGSPAVLELADTPYELDYPLRGAMQIFLRIGLDAVTFVKVERNDGAKIVYPLTDIQRVWDVVLDGRPPRLPPRMQAAFEAGYRSRTQVPEQGPAVVLRVPDGEWVVPTDEAPGVGRIIHRRMMTARSGIRPVT